VPENKVSLSESLAKLAPSYELSNSIETNTAMQRNLNKLHWITSTLYSLILCHDDNFQRQSTYELRTTNY